MISEVYNEDCMIGMARYPDKFFDLAIVDPPYGIGEDGRNNHTRGKLAKAKDYRSKSRYDNAIPDRSYFKELMRVSKNQIIWGGNYFPLPPTKGWIIWKKRDIKTDFNQLEMAWTSNLKMGFFDFLWHGMWQQDMKNKEKRIHPNHKPIALYKWIIFNYSKIGQKIIDTHMGSQSSRIASYQMGFDYYGWEIDKKYFEEGCNRFKEQTAQLDMYKNINNEQNYPSHC
jgi:site-specific DNA-methyltransferase (adenine-specific)